MELRFLAQKIWKRYCWRSLISMKHHRLALQFFIGLALFIYNVELTADEFFTSRIEPILKKNCYECHSHQGKIKGGLALDSKSGWERGGDSGPAIVPENTHKSLLIKMVRWTDEDHQMPPKNQLKPSQISLLEEWVQKGAPDPRTIEFQEDDPLDWWSLKPLVKTEVPKGIHPVDYFIKRKLNEKGLPFSSEADKRALARRLYVDLHGMLPTPTSVKSFIEDAGPQAWENLIQKLLNSPRYGERWARHWLDVIHFADSHGCEHDVKRPNAWRFRDYVIGRLNADVAWDRFINEQLAPDVFYPDEPEKMAGLGFIAAGPLELSRAGTAPVTFDYLDRDDMVSQTMGAFTSSTANCARCHDHKFDPISQEDYYSLQAVFAGIGKGDIEFEPSKVVMEKRKELESIIRAAQTKDKDILLKKRFEHLIKDWEKEWQSNPPAYWDILRPHVFVASGGANLLLEDDASLFVSGPMQDVEHYTINAQPQLDQISAIRVEAFKDSRLPKGGPGRAENGNFHISEVEFRWFPNGAKEGVKLNIARASASFDQEGWTSKQAIDGDNKSGWAIYPRVNESHFITFELEEPISTSKNGYLSIVLKQLYPPKHYLGKFRISVTNAPNGAAITIPPLVRSGLSKDPKHRTEAEQIAMASYVLKSNAEKRLKLLPEKEVVYGVSRSWSHAKKLEDPQEPKIVHLLKRGNIDQPIRKVKPGSLSAIPHLPGRFEISDLKNEALRRSALAHWITHKDNPLTWRSIVNRVWHFHFGRGLSDTPNDFGRMGSAPSHPELLDWLAIWFRDEAKGSLKKLHTLILTSHTWKQSSLNDHTSDDSENIWLSRMHRRRLDAESFRDSVLSLSGVMDFSMGGPGIEQFKKSKGPQSTPALDYTQFDWNATNAKRRSIYRVVWRGIPDPFMDALDFPDMALLSPKRNFSVSPLQSLALFNNDFVLHAAQWMSESLTSKPNPVYMAVETCWQRPPTDLELTTFKAYSNKHGLAALCRVLLNSNEFLFID